MAYKLFYVPNVSHNQHCNMNSLDQFSTLLLKSELNVYGLTFLNGVMSCFQNSAPNIDANVEVMTCMFCMQHCDFVCAWILGADKQKGATDHSVLNGKCVHRIIIPKRTDHGRLVYVVGLLVVVVPVVVAGSGYGWWWLSWWQWW